MKIFSRNSWHYKLVDLFLIPKEEDFCSYCRQVLISILTLIVLSFVILIVLPLFLGIVVVEFISVFTIFPDIETIFTTQNKLLVFFGLIFSGYIIALLIFIILYLLDKCVYQKYQTYSRNKRNTLVIKEKEPSLVKEWYKSFKGKYCPRVEFKD